MLGDSRTESQSPVTSACISLLEYHKHLATEVLVEQTAFHSPVAALDHESVNTRIVEIYKKTAARILFPLIGRGILGVCLLDVWIMLVQPGIIVDVIQYFQYIDSVPLTGGGMCACSLIDALCMCIS